MDAAVAGDLCPVAGDICQPVSALQKVSLPSSISVNTQEVHTGNCDWTRQNSAFYRCSAGLHSLTRLVYFVRLCMLTLTALLVLLGHTKDNMHSLEVFRNISCFLEAYSHQMQSRWMGASTSAILLGVLGDAPMLRHT